MEEDTQDVLNRYGDEIIDTIMKKKQEFRDKKAKDRLSIVGLGDEMMRIDNQHLTIFNNGEVLVKISMKNASVQFGENADIDLAAKQFWRAVAIANCYQDIV